MKTCTYNHNAVSPDGMMLLADGGAAGIIKTIHAVNKTAEQLLR